VDTITPPMVLQVIRNIESRGALEVAHKVLQRMNAVFRYAVQTGKATFNPAGDMKGVLKTRKVVHMAALSREELPEFLRVLTVADIHTTTRLALKFTLLTAARSGEVRGATWEEINLDEAIWRIPPERMKMDSPHNVPLSKQAVAILERVGRLYGKEGLVFPGIRQNSKQLSENTLLYALYRIGYHSKATVHGFRATFSTIANESGFDGDVIEKALAHEQRNRVRAAYHRSEYLEQRRKLMQWWADLLDQMEAGAEIIPIRRKTAK
jgi:integrase